jgi:hypothetical protein
MSAPIAIGLAHLLIGGAYALSSWCVSASSHCTSTHFQGEQPTMKFRYLFEVSASVVLALLVALVAPVAPAAASNLVNFFGAVGTWPDNTIVTPQGIDAQLAWAQMPREGQIINSPVALSDLNTTLDLDWYFVEAGMVGDCRIGPPEADCLMHPYMAAQDGRGGTYTLVIVYTQTLGTVPYTWQVLHVGDEDSKTFSQVHYQRDNGTWYGFCPYFVTGSGYPGAALTSCHINPNNTYDFTITTFGTAFFTSIGGGS